MSSIIVGLVFCLYFICCGYSFLTLGNVTTFGGVAGSSGSTNGIGTNTRFNAPRGISISPDGSYALIADWSNHLIRHIVISTASVTTLAGLAGTTGSTNGIGTDSRFNNPRGISISPDGSYALIADWTNHLVRHIIISTASVTTLAGFAETTGSTNGIGTNSRFHLPNGVSISPDGSYALVTGFGNHLVRHIVISTSSVTTFAGSGTTGSTNGIGTNSRFGSPVGVSISADGSFALVAEYTAHVIRHIIISTASVTTLAGFAGTTGSTNGIGTDSRFNNPYEVSISPDGSYALVAEWSNHLIRHIVISTASVTTLAGFAGTTGSTNGIGTNSRFHLPVGVSISPDGSYALIADTGNHLIRHIITSTISNQSRPPTLLPSCVPTGAPTASPSTLPTLLPSCVPTGAPTASPSTLPTLLPSCVPTGAPTASPSASPTLLPSCVPTGAPTASPSTSPTLLPSYVPTGAPTASPSTSPTLLPSCVPTGAPTASPSTSPTLCCRLLMARLNFLVVDDVSALGLALTLDVGPVAVADFLTVSISGVDVDTLLSRSLFSPSVVAFTADSSLSTQLTYTPVLKGTYRVTILLSGPSSVDYKVSFPLGDLLIVKGLEDVLSAPWVQRAAFNSDGSKIIVTFSSPTNRGDWTSIFNCKMIFSSLDSTTCVWSSDTSIEILVSSVRSSSLLVVGDTLTIKRGVYKAKCTSKVDPSCVSWGSNDLQNVTISTPAVVQSPVVTLSLASQIGPCDDLTVDVSPSSGSGGRVWKSVSFIVQGSDPNITRIRSFLTTLSVNPSLLMRSSVIVPSAFFSPGYSYSLEVTLCNFLDGCGSRLKSFVVTLSSGVPVVLLNSQSQISIFRNTTLTISGDAYVSSCDGARSRSNLLYSWSLLKDGIVLTSSDVQSVSVNPREFKLPPYRLVVESLYQVQLEVKHSRSMMVSSMSVDVFVRSGDVICEYVGGEKLGLHKDDSLLLDFSRSYDSNLYSPPSSLFPSFSGILFEWRCYRMYPSYRNACEPLVLSPLSSSFSQILVTVNRSVSMVDTVEVGDIFEIIMIGKSPSDAQDSRRCQRVIEISILDSLAPSVVLELLSSLKMNPSSNVKILGRVEMKSRGEVKWSVSDASIQLSSVAMSPISQYLPPSPSNSPHVVSLVLVGNSLPQQSSFTFTLSCFLSNGYSSSSSVSIITNSPPFGGVLEVDPRHGVMLETVFAMSGLSWLDEDLPLSYEFGYLSYFASASSTRTANPLDDTMVVRSKMELSYTSTLLPSGYRSYPISTSTDHANLTCAVMVFDQLDSSSHSLFDVTIEEVKMDLVDLKAFLLRGINMSETSNNLDDLKSTLSNVVTVLNRLNCSSAPDCKLLNRRDCSSVEGTCGECIEGYVGLMGSSNTPCMALSDYSSRHLLLNEKSSVPSCDDDGSCAKFGIFMECSPSTHLCQPIQQTCLNSCSGHGRCEFVSKYNPEEKLSECGLLDVGCTVHCECEEGYTGSSCSVTLEDMIKQMELRQVIVQNLNSLVGLENADLNNLKSYLMTLSSLGSDFQSFDLQTKNMMTLLTIEILSLSLKLGASHEVLMEAGLGRVIDVCLSNSMQSLSVDSPEMYLLQSYGHFAISDMSENQYSVSSVNTFVRSSIFFASPPTLNSSLRLSIPLTVLESLSESQSQIQHSVETSLGIRFPVQISLAQINTQMPTTTLVINSSSKNETIAEFQLSLPLLITFKSSPCVNHAQGDCLLHTTLKNQIGSATMNRVLSSGSTEPLYFEVHCQKNKIEEHSFLCPSGEVVSIYCNGSVSMLGRQYCPEHSETIECRVTSSLNIPCYFSLQNDSSTLCVCNLSQIGSIDDKDSVSFSIISIQKSVTREFLLNWRSVGTLSSENVLDSWVVLVTVGSIGVSFLIFLLMGIEYDVYERKRISCSDNRNSSWFVGVLPSDRSQSRGNNSNPLNINEDLALIEESLPAVFKSDSLWNKFREEMKVYHRWIGIVFYYSPEFPRSMRVMSLFTSIVIMLFVQSVTYSIADPDDGSCEACDDESCCLSMKSTLNGNENRCYWGVRYSSTNDTLVNGSCHFRDIGQDMTRMFIVALISSIVSAPLALSVQYLIVNVLSKETLNMDEVDQAKQLSQFMRIQRILATRRTTSLSGGSQDLVEECGRSLQEDLHNLLRDVSSYYHMLLNQNGKQAKEFKNVWGPVLDESAVQTFSLMKLSKRLPQVMRISSASDEHTRVIQDLLKDLSYVRKEVSREYQIFQDPDTSTSNSHIFLQQQQQRLMLLFLKDISMGLCHHILANKIQREEIFSKGCHTSTVSRQLNAISLPWHILGWIFLLALNFGMLFYVYLFAMNQSHSRQSAWLKSFLMWLGFDFLIASTSMVFVTHLLIPLYVLADITKLKEKVLTDLTSFRNQWMKSQSSKTKQKIQKSSNTFLSSSSPQQFNSAKYLYVSWRIASLLHNLQFKRTSLPCHPSSNPEDDLTWTRSGTIMLILQYHTIWPKKSYGLRGVEIQDEYQENVLINGLTQILLYFITSFFNSHTSGLILQDIVIQMISITGFGFVIILLIRLWHFSSILCISILIIFFLFIVILLKYLQSSPSSLVSNSSNVNQTIHPINDDTCVKENQEGENEKQEEEEEMEMLEEGVENEKDDAHDCDDDSISVRRNNILSSSSSDLNQSSSASSSSSFSYFSHSHDNDNSGDVASDSSSQSDIESAIVIRKIDQTKNIRKSDDIENVCEA